MLPSSSLQASIQDGLHVQGVTIPIPVKQNALEEEWTTSSCMDNIVLYTLMKKK